MTNIYNWFSANNAFQTLDRLVKAQTTVIDSQTKVIAKLEKRLKNTEDSTAFLIQLLAENGAHAFDCSLAQSMRNGDTHRLRPACDCWIDKLANP